MKLFLPIIIIFYNLSFLFTMSDSKDSLALIKAMKIRDCRDFRNYPDYRNEIQTLIQSENDLNKQNQCGETMLMVIAWNGGRYAAEMMSLLVNAGADIDMQSQAGATALMLAACNGGGDGEWTWETVGFLIDAKADVNKCNKSGWTALMCAAKYGGRHGEYLLERLVNAGANKETQNKYGKTALMYAAEYQDMRYATKMVRFLVDDTDPNLDLDDNIKALLEQPKLVNDSAPSGGSLFGSRGVVLAGACKRVKIH